jgi:hypothetical protein
LRGNKDQTDRPVFVTHFIAEIRRNVSLLRPRGYPSRRSRREALPVSSKKNSVSPSRYAHARMLPVLCVADKSSRTPDKSCQYESLRITR